MRAGLPRDSPQRFSSDGAIAGTERLDADQRALLALHHLEGRDVAELAATLGVPAGTVKSRLFGARRALRAALDAEAAE